jgi:hypothetical protein
MMDTFHLWAAGAILPNAPLDPGTAAPPAWVFDASGGDIVPVWDAAPPADTPIRAVSQPFARPLDAAACADEVLQRLALGRPIHPEQVRALAELLLMQVRVVDAYRTAAGS